MNIEECYKNSLKYINEGKYDEAIDYLDKIIEYYEKKLGIKSNEDYKNLVDKLKNLNERDIELFVLAWCYKGNALKKLGNLKGAIECYDKALDINPNSIYALDNKGYVLRRLGKYKEAMECFKKSQELKPDSPKSLNGIGYVYYSLGDYEEAIKYFKKSLNVERNIYALNGMGYSCAYLRDYEEAIKYFKEALEMEVKDSDKVYSLNGLGYVFSNKGKYEKAIEYFEKVWKIDLKFYGSINTIFEYLKNEIYDDKKVEKIFELLRKIVFYIIAFKSRIIVVDKKTIYHYTKPNVIVNILESENSYFRLYNACYMNDPEEGKVFLRIILNNKLNNLKKVFGIREEKDVENFKENKEIQKFIGSFVIDRDNLFLWRTYGKDRDNEEAKGICIGITKGFFNDIPDHFETLKDGEINRELFCLYYIVYEDDNDNNYNELKKVLKKIDNLIKKLLNKTCENKEEKETVKRIIRSLLDEIRYLVKSKYYKEEKECRVVKVYNLKFHKYKIKLDKDYTPPRLYVEIEKDLRNYIKEIILGPRLENLEAWEAYLNYHLHDYNIEIKRSNCNFR